MATKRYTAEQIISKLREAEVLLAKGISVSQASKQIGIVEQTLGDEVLKREIFYTLEEAQIIIEMWRNEYNQIRPHSSLGYRSPVPETVTTWKVPAGGADPSGLTQEVVQ
jgi:transposase InsO family protein